MNIKTGQMVLYKKVLILLLGTFAVLSITGCIATGLTIRHNRAEAQAEAERLTEDQTQSDREADDLQFPFTISYSIDGVYHIIEDVIYLHYEPNSGNITDADRSHGQWTLRLKGDSPYLEEPILVLSEQPSPFAEGRTIEVGAVFINFGTAEYFLGMPEGEGQEPSLRYEEGYQTIGNDHAKDSRTITREEAAQLFGIYITQWEFSPPIATSSD